MKENDHPSPSQAQVLSACQLKIAQALDQAEQFLGCKLPKPSLDFSLRGKTAGQMCAYSRLSRTDYKIRLNMPLAQAYLPLFIEEVIPHEIAHLVVMHCWGIKKTNKIKPHGPEWRSIMTRCFQLEPVIHHTMELKTHNKPKRKMQTIAYECACQDHALSQIRHKRALQGTNYHCVRCKQKLQLKYNENKITLQPAL